MSNGVDFKKISLENRELLNSALAREDALREELDALRESYEAMRDRKSSIVELQQRLTVAERRESEAREELLELSRKLEVFYSRSHGIKNLSEIEKANDEAKNLKLKVREYEVLLNISKELLTTISRHGATTKPVDWCDSFKAEVAGRIEKIGAALKPASEVEALGTRPAGCCCPPKDHNGIWAAAMCPVHFGLKRPGVSHDQ